MCNAGVAGETEQWRKIRDVDGMQLFTHEVKDSPILMVKAIALIDADVASIRAVVDDLAHHQKWVPYLVETRLLQQVSPTEKLLYSRFDAPWPVSDRDFVYRLNISVNENGTVSYRHESEKSPLMPAQKDYVRARLMESTYTMTPVTPTQTRVEILFHADPRGWLPLWLVNLVERRFPLLALKGLKERLAER
jgi:hypothetical protein